MTQDFNEQFLDWFRDSTEARWRAYNPKSFEDYVANGVGGYDWQRYTRWLCGLTEQEILAIERQWSMCFPSDYRLFLKTLHSVDKPLLGATYNNSQAMIPASKPSFYNWYTDMAAIQNALDWLIEGIFFDVVHNGLWHTNWGEKPLAQDEQKARLKSLIAAAPQLIPIFGHRYLLADPCQAGNPILSIYQSDIIVYSPNLYSYFFAEFGNLLERSEQALNSIRGRSELRIKEQYQTYTGIPFWGEFFS